MTCVRCGRSELLTCLVLKPVSNQNTVRLSRFSPFQVDGVKTSRVYREEPRNIWHYNNTHTVYVLMQTRNNTEELREETEVDKKRTAVSCGTITRYNRWSLKISLKV